MSAKMFAGLLLVAGLLVTAACGDNTESDSGEVGGKPTVVATFFPVYYMAEQIGGDDIDLSCPLPAGSDPIYWEPADKDLEVFRAADLVVANGAGFEKWMEVVSLPESRVIKTAQPLEKDLIYIEGTTHNHGGQGEHSHSGKDGHTWVDPENARIQARQILERLVSLLPEKSDELRRRHLDLDKRLAALAGKYAELGKAHGKTPLFASHPAYNYLVRRIGLNVMNFDLDPEDMITDRQIEKITQARMKHKAASMLWESAPSDANAKSLEQACSVQSIVFTPCEDPGLAGQDFIKLMEINLENLRQALAKP